MIINNEIGFKIILISYKKNYQEKDLIALRVGPSNLILIKKINNHLKKFEVKLQRLNLL